MVGSSSSEPAGSARRWGGPVASQGPRPGISTSGRLPIPANGVLAASGQPHVFAPGGFLSGSNVPEHLLNIVIESGGVRLPDGPKFSDIRFGSVCLVSIVVLLHEFVWRANDRRLVASLATRSLDPRSRGGTFAMWRRFHVSRSAPVSEAWLEPLLKAMIEQFPFRIRGFHSDNGSEFLNRTVEKLLNKLLIEQTKSRPRHSNDNGLVESKNGAVIRKHMGYTYIAAPHAGRIQRFYQQHFNPYLNFHRPCGQPEIKTDAKGKQKRVYRHYQTPWESFEKLPEAASYLKPGQRLEALGRIAQAESDTAAARRMQRAKQKLFASFRSANTPC